MAYSTNGSHCMMDPSGTHAALHYFEAATLAENDVGCWDSDVLEDEVRVAVGSVVVAVYGEHALDFNAGGIGWNNDDGLLLVFVWMVRVRLS